MGITPWTDEKSAVPAQVPVAPAAEEPATATTFEPAAVSAPPTSAYPSFWGMVLFGFLLVTLLFAGGLAWIAWQMQVPDLNLRPSVHDPDLVGLWSTDFDDPPDAGKRLFYAEAGVYPTHMEFSEGRGTVRVDGRWHDDGFWIPKADGSGDVEIAKLKSPEELEVHIAAFDPKIDEVNVLYKQRGNDAEMKAIADRYPLPLTYPPPSGVIKFWMTEYDLKSLPWKSDHTEIYIEDAYSRSVKFTYHSDNPKIEPLIVTVKNHRVAKIEGGNP